MDNTSAANQKHINSSSAWVMVSLMMVAYIFSFVDRYILGLLIEPIKADLNLTDTQIGLLLGPAFAIFMPRWDCLLATLPIDQRESQSFLLESLSGHLQQLHQVLHKNSGIFFLQGWWWVWEKLH